MGKARVETVSLDDLVPDPLNARVRDERAAGALSKSVEAFGLGRSVVVDSGGVVRAGNGTLEAARAAGVREVVIVETDGTQLVAVKRPDWTEAQAVAYAIADNRTGDLSSFDGEALRGIMSALVDAAAPTEAGALDAIGFSDRALTELFETGRVALPTAPKHAAPSALLEVDAPPLPTTPVTKPGDVWILGEHRLVCGDCRESSVTSSAFRDGPWSLLVTDPPYGVSYAGKNEFLNSMDKGNHIQAEIENDHATVDEMSALWRRAFEEVRQHGAAGSAYYVTGPQGGDLLLLLLLSLRDAGFPLRHMLIWVKNNHVIGRSDYNYKHEPIVYGWLEGAAHPFVSATSDTSVWEIDRPQSSKLHPTMKPVELYARAMRNSSVAGGVVADPFAGSGTAIVAAEQLGRRAVAIEVSPHYCDVIVSRWESLTGKRADRRSAL